MVVLTAKFLGVGGGMRVSFFLSDFTDYGGKLDMVIRQTAMIGHRVMEETVRAMSSK